MLFFKLLSISSIALKCRGSCLMMCSPLGPGSCGRVFGRDGVLALSSSVHSIVSPETTTSLVFIRSVLPVVSIPTLFYLSFSNLPPHTCPFQVSFWFWQATFTIVLKTYVQVRRQCPIAQKPLWSLFSPKDPWRTEAVTIAVCVYCFRMAKTTLFFQYQRLWAWKRIQDSLCLPHLFPVRRKRKCVTPNSIMTTQQESGTAQGQHPLRGLQGRLGRGQGRHCVKLPRPLPPNVSPDTHMKGDAPGEVWGGELPPICSSRCCHSSSSEHSQPCSCK